MQATILPFYTCSYCTKSFQRKRQKHAPKIYCSHRCSNLDTKRRSLEGKCKDCSKAISSSHIRCSDCRNKFKNRAKKPKNNLQAVKSFYKRTKQRAVEYLGSKCMICGYDRFAGALQFHHKDPSQKSFTISGRTISWKRLQPELDKCALLCANCHAEVEGDFSLLPNTGGTGQI